MQLLGKKWAPSAKPPRQALASGVAAALVPCHLPTVLALPGVCREPVPPWVCLVAPREGVLRSPCHCDGGTQHRGYNPAPLSAFGVFSNPYLHRTRCGVQHGSSAATFCPQPLVGTGAWGQWARGDNGSTGTMGAWGQWEHGDRLRPRRCCDTAQRGRAPLLHNHGCLICFLLLCQCAPVTFRGTLGAQRTPRIGEDPSTPRQGDPDLYQHPWGAVCETSRGEKHHQDGFLGHPDVSQCFLSLKSGI